MFYIIYFNFQFIAALLSFFHSVIKKGINYNSPDMSIEEMSATEVAVLIQTHNYSSEGPGQSTFTKIMNRQKLHT